MYIPPLYQLSIFNNENRYLQSLFKLRHEWFIIVAGNYQYPIFNEMLKSNIMRRISRAHKGNGASWLLFIRRNLVEEAEVD